MTYYLITKYANDFLYYKNLIQKNTSLTIDSVNPHYLFVFGGDGTFLHAFERFNTRPVYININKGTLGFYANFSVDDLDQIFNAINNNGFKIQYLTVLAARLKANNRYFYYNSLNEITISSIPRTLVANVYLNGEKFETFRGTGLLISTPEGSSAYNKSLNGAVVDHSLNIMQLTEIAGINSNSYRTLNSPLILSDKYSLSIDLASHYKKINITHDNHLQEVSNFESLDIKISNRKARLAYINKTPFLTKIKKSFLP